MAILKQTSKPARGPADWQSKGAANEECGVCLPPSSFVRLYYAFAARHNGAGSGPRVGIVVARKGPKGAEGWRQIDLRKVTSVTLEMGHLEPLTTQYSTGRGWKI